MDRAIKDISRRVAGTEVTSLPDANMLSAENPWSLFTKTEGDYDLTVILSTDRQVLKEMTCNMKRGGEASEADVSAYMREFFNIWCGHVISAVNRAACLKAEFAVASMIEGIYEHSAHRTVGFHGQYYYESPYGIMKLEALYHV